MSLEDDISAVEEEIKTTSYNKATSHHIGKLKAKLARLKEESLKKASMKSGGDGFAVRKSGHATVVLVGVPSVGKSTLLNSLTGAESAVAAFEFTTLTTVPGMMDYKGAQIQILDIPGLIKGAARGGGRGREVISVIRSADMVLIMLDVFNLGEYHVLMKELYDAGIRVNARPPDVVIKQKTGGGIHINSTIQNSISRKVIKSVLSEYKIHNAEVLIREDITVDQLIDAIHGNRRYVPGLIVINKVDLSDANMRENARVLFPDALFISANRNLNIERLKEMIFDTLGFIRVYLKPQGEAADLDEPLIVRRGARVGEVCNQLHRDFRRNFRYAQAWGDSAKHAGQRVGINHILKDGDILSIIMKR